MKKQNKESVIILVPIEEKNTLQLYFFGDLEIVIQKKKKK